jgi:hypothetical protein
MQSADGSRVLSGGWNQMLDVWIGVDTGSLFMEDGPCGEGNLQEPWF